AVGALVTMINNPVCGVQGTMRNGKCQKRPALVNFPAALSIIFQALNRFDAGNEREAIITVWKRFAMQIDCVDLGTRNGEQFIRVIASERTKRIMASKQPQ